MSGEPKPSQDGHQPLQTLGKFLPSKQPVVGSNPTGGVTKDQTENTKGAELVLTTHRQDQPKPIEGR